MGRSSASVAVILLLGLCWVEAQEEDLASTVKFLQEQVSALLDHRQEDYNALEDSLKRSMEKNTELIVLRNEIKQMRKELSSLRSSGQSSGLSSGPLSAQPLGTNEAKNDRLRLRWLASTVSELQSELAEVMRARNASEEFAERARLRSEIELLRADVAGLGRGVRDLGGRMDRLEASLGTVRLDVTAAKQRAGQLSRTCADLGSQLSNVQLEMRLIKCDDCSEKRQDISSEDSLLKNEIGQSGNTDTPTNSAERQQHHARHALSRLPSALHRLDERMNKLEHKIAQVSRRRALLEKRVVYESEREGLERRVHILESIGRDHANKLRNVSKELSHTRRFGESVVGLFESLDQLEERLVANQSESKREIARLDVNAARKAAELSLTREELANLRRAVQALSVSASKLQEKSDAQQAAIGRLTDSLEVVGGIGRAENITKELERVEDEYRMMVDALPGNCEQKDGLTLLAPGPGAPLLAACRKGWIVVGRRVDGTVDFDRTWNDYATGFGSPMNEFWAGNEALHRLSRDNCTRLRIELNDIDGNYWVANYENFSVGGEETGYKLRVSGYSGNASDAMAYQNNMAFSAKDRDMDISSTDCAANYHGGWWFSHCQHANLNGRYSLGLTWYRSDENQWMAVASTELSVQRKQQCL